MTGGQAPRLHQATGVSDYDAAAWTSLPPVRGVVQGRGGWGVLLQEPEVAPRGFRAVEVEAPEPAGVMLLLALAAGRNEGHLSGTGAARPLRVTLRRGDALLLPPGTASRWHSSTGQERILHLNLPLAFLDGVAAQGGGEARPDLLPPGLLRRDATLDFLLRHIVRQIRDREAGWRIAIDSALTLVTAQLLAAAAPRRRTACRDERAADDAPRPQPAAKRDRGGKEGEEAVR